MLASSTVPYAGLDVPIIDISAINGLLPDAEKSTCNSFFRGFALELVDQIAPIVLKFDPECASNLNIACTRMQLFRVLLFRLVWPLDSFTEPPPGIRHSAVIHPSHFAHCVTKLIQLHFHMIKYGLSLLEMWHESPDTLLQGQTVLS